MSIQGAMQIPQGHGPSTPDMFDACIGRIGMQIERLDAMASRINYFFDKMLGPCASPKGDGNSSAQVQPPPNLNSTIDRLTRAVDCLEMAVARGANG